MSAVVGALVARVLCVFAIGGCPARPVAPAPVVSSPRPAVRPHPRLAPVAAIRAFATEYINWTAGTVTAHLRLLAAASTGQARSAMQLAAAGAARDYELQHGGVANAGTVQAVAPLPGASHRYVVVTREQTSAARSAAYRGLGPAWHVTIAMVSLAAPGLWVVSGWQPES